MDQGGHRRRPLHRVRQPGVEKQLRRLAGSPDEQQHPDHLVGAHVEAEQVVERVGMRRHQGEDVVVADGAELGEGQRDADHEEQIGDPVDHEGLVRRRLRARPVIPVADQQVAREPDAFPAEEQLDQVVRRDQHQHREAEQRQIGKEARRRPFLVRHVADAVDVDQRRHHGDHRHHLGGQRIEAQHPGRVKAARLHPIGDRHGQRRRARFQPERQRPDAADRRQHHHADADQLSGAIADRAAEQAGDDRPQQRREHGDCEKGWDGRHLSPSWSAHPRPRSSRGCGNRR